MNGMTSDERTQIAIRAGGTGIVCNLLLFLLKIVIGVVGHSVSVTADAFNNLSDAGSAVISVAASKIAAREADRDHPFGHGRIEYLAAFLVAFFIVLVGGNLMESAVGKLLHPEELLFSWGAFIALGCSVVMKFFLGLYYRAVAHRIDSQVYKASAADAFQDMAVTLATMGSLLIFGLWKRNVDAWIGLLVSVLVLRTGITLLFDTMAPLIGGNVDSSLYKRIQEIVEEHEGIFGSHDLILHNYGPEQYMGTIHVEVDGTQNLFSLHELMDHIERQVLAETKVKLVIHFDPVDNRDEARFYKDKIGAYLEDSALGASYHDFHMHEDQDGRKHILFDVLLPWEQWEQEKVLKDGLERMLQDLDPQIHSTITVDHPFAGEEGD